METYKHILSPVVLMVILTLFFSCGQRKSKSTVVEQKPTMVEVVEDVEETPIVKDSIDLAMEERARHIFNSTIFMGLRFGSDKNTVEKVLKNRRIYKDSYGTEIPIQVPFRDMVQSVVIRDYDAQYFNGKLASLVLYANEASLLDALAILYQNKYGPTKAYDIYGDCKGYEWEYSNCEIVIRTKNRHERISEYVTNVNAPKMYYNSYRGTRVEYLTKDRSFLEISYENQDMLLAIAKQEHVKDSLENDKRMKAIQKEKELAKKLEQEIPTNI